MVFVGAACGTIPAAEVDANANTAVDARAVAKDGTGPADAIPDSPKPPFDVLCMGDTPPATAVESLRVFGTVVDGASNAPIAGSSVEVRRTTDDGILGSTTADDLGNYSLVVSTGGVPLPAYVRFVATDFLPTNVYVPDPLTEGRNIHGRLARGVDMPYEVAGLTRDAKLGTVFVTVTDCAGNTITTVPATISFSPGVPKILYRNQGTLDPGASSTDEGFGVGLNTATGDVLVGAEAAGIHFEARPCRTHPGERMFMTVHP